MTIIYHKCKHANSTGSRFCSACGSPISPETPLRAGSIKSQKDLDNRLFEGQTLSPSKRQLAQILIPILVLGVIAVGVLVAISPKILRRTVAATTRRISNVSPPVVVTNPDYLVVRSLRLESDADHPTRVDLPYAGAGYAFASREKLLDLNDFVLTDVRFMTKDVEGRPLDRPSLLIPLKSLSGQKFSKWTSGHVGLKVGIFLAGKLIEAPEIRSRIDAAIPITSIPDQVGAKNVLGVLQRGGS